MISLLLNYSKLKAQTVQMAFEVHQNENVSLLTVTVLEFCPGAGYNPVITIHLGLGFWPPGKRTWNITLPFWFVLRLCHILGKDAKSSIMFTSYCIH